MMVCVNRQEHGVVRLIAVAACLFLMSCTGSYDPASVPAVYSIRNAPIPVPLPKPKPSVSAVQARAKAQARSGVRVAQGDTVYALARRFGVTPKALIVTNRLRAPYRLAVGQRLRLPGDQTHTVRRGETTYSISRRYGVSLQALVSLNRLRRPYRLSVGQRLKIPGGATATRRVASNRATTQTRPAASSKPRSVRTQPPGRAASRFAWPVSGRIISGFGPKEGGIHNDGINILARKGTAVKAADNGVVVYADDDLEGYGNLVLIRHDSGWVTAYAHNDSVAVKEGDIVKRNQQIARVGATGGVPQPQLHFEVRKGRTALDPLRYLTRQ